MFEFEKLDVYQLALEFCEDIEHILKTVVRTERVFYDQLRRASLSILLNIAEGCGRWGDGEKRQFYLIARGSVFECVPIVTLLARRHCIDEALQMKLKEKPDRLAGMLTKLSQRFSRDHDTCS